MSEPVNDFGRFSLRKFVIKLHDDGWIVTLCMMALVLMGGIWSLWRASAQEQQIRETRATLERVDEMLRERTKFFDQIEKNQQFIIEEIKKYHEPTHGGRG